MGKWRKIIENEKSRNIWAEGRAIDTYTSFFIKCGTIEIEYIFSKYLIFPYKPLSEKIIFSYSLPVSRSFQNVQLLYAFFLIFFSRTWQVQMKSIFQSPFELEETIKGEKDFIKEVKANREITFGVCLVSFKFQFIERFQNQNSKIKWSTRILWNAIIFVAATITSIIYFNFSIVCLLSEFYFHRS